MNAQKREQIRRTLKSLAEAHTSTIQFMEQAVTLFSGELALDPLTFWKSRQPSAPASKSSSQPFADEVNLEIRYRDRTCFLGNTLPFRFFVRLSRRDSVEDSREHQSSNTFSDVQRLPSRIDL